MPLSPLLKGPFIGRKQVPTAAERLLGAAKKALLGADDQRWCGVMGCAVGRPPAAHERLAIAVTKAASVAGARLVSGWCLDEVRRKGASKLVVILQHHAVIELPGGELLCPTTPVGEEINFLRDGRRPHDLGADGSGRDPALSWNTAVYANTSVRGRLGVVEPFTLTWAARWADGHAYSAAPAHSRWASWSQRAPLEVLRNGALGVAALDLAMTTDLNDLAAAIGVHPHPADLSQEALEALVNGLSVLQQQGAFREV